MSPVRAATVASGTTEQAADDQPDGDGGCNDLPVPQRPGGRAGRPLAQQAAHGLVDALGLANASTAASSRGRSASATARPRACKRATRCLTAGRAVVGAQHAAWLASDVRPAGRSSPRHRHPPAARDRTSCSNPRMARRDARPGQRRRRPVQWRPRTAAPRARPHRPGAASASAAAMARLVDAGCRQESAYAPAAAAAAAQAARPRCPARRTCARMCSGFARGPRRARQAIAPIARHGHSSPHRRTQAEHECMSTDMRMP